jgi:hypothetical protein
MRHCPIFEHKARDLARWEHHLTASNNPPSKDRTTISLRNRAELAVLTSLHVVNDALAEMGHAL